MFFFFFFFFKQKTAYDVRSSDWSSDVCSSDLGGGARRRAADARVEERSLPRRAVAALAAGCRYRCKVARCHPTRHLGIEPAVPAARRDDPRAVEGPGDQ